MTTKKTALAAIVCAAFLSAPAFAGDHVFQYDREALGYSSGVKNTLDRIDDFADRTCKASSRGLWAQRVKNECMTAIRAELIEQIDDPRLAAAAAQRLAQN